MTLPFPPLSFSLRPRKEIGFIRIPIPGHTACQSVTGLCVSCRLCRPSHVLCLPRLPPLSIGASTLHADCQSHFRPPAEDRRGKVPFQMEGGDPRLHRGAAKGEFLNTYGCTRTAPFLLPLLYIPSQRRRLPPFFSRTHY